MVLGIDIGVVLRLLTNQALSFLVMLRREYHGQCLRSRNVSFKDQLAFLPIPHQKLAGWLLNLATLSLHVVLKLSVSIEIDT